MEGKVRWNGYERSKGREGRACIILPYMYNSFTFLISFLSFSFFIFKGPKKRKREKKSNYHLNMKSKI